ncbi:MAG TPA: GNAT family N-acetyltransferase [Ktedonobacterales bacterium]|nr:GNAT family N-acetyltransferase [Ktedonobacterales bacterium]
MGISVPPHVEEEDLRLREGSVVHLRPIRGDDNQRLQDFHAHLSDVSIIHRFFGYVPVLSEDMATHFTHLDYADEMAFVVTIPDGEDMRIVGVGRYSRVGPECAEIAFTVADAWQGRGIATELLFRLAWYARAHGFRRFIAYVMPDNLPMITVFKHCGIPVCFHRDEQTVVATLDISRSDRL